MAIGSSVQIAMEPSIQELSGNRVCHVLYALWIMAPDVCLSGTPTVSLQF